jgi:hypothetical protein
MARPPPWSVPASQEWMVLLSFESRTWLYLLEMILDTSFTVDFKGYFLMTNFDTHYLSFYVLTELCRNFWQCFSWVLCLIFHVFGWKTPKNRWKIMKFLTLRNSILKFFLTKCIYFQIDLLQLLIHKIWCRSMNLINRFHKSKFWLSTFLKFSQGCFQVYSSQWYPVVDSLHQDFISFFRGGFKGIPVVTSCSAFRNLSQGRGVSKGIPVVTSISSTL